MAGLVPAFVPAIHDSFFSGRIFAAANAWMPGTSPGMTKRETVMNIRAAALVLLAGLASPGIVLLAPAFPASPVSAQTFSPGTEGPEDYPEGPSREAAFYACTPCHGFKIVAQQGQTRSQWEDTLDVMTRRHGMPPVDGDLRRMVLDYLEATFPPRKGPGGWTNPFAK
jgi:hypothetical protein